MFLKIVFHFLKNEMNISDQQNLYFSKDFAFPFILIFKVFICFIQAKFEGNPFSWSSMAPRRVCKVPQPMGIQSLTRGAGGNERVQTEELRGMRTKGPALAGCTCSQAPGSSRPSDLGLKLRSHRSQRSRSPQRCIRQYGFTGS